MKTYPSLLLMLSICLLMACSNVSVVEIKNDEGVVVEKYERNKESLAKNGHYTAFYESGEVRELATYKNDTLNGTQVFFFESGDTLEINNLKMGIYDGISKAFYKSGQLNTVFYYKNNAIEGLSKSYYENGQLKEVVQFVDGEEEGPFEEWYENGNKKASGNYLRGADSEHGLLEMYNEEGVLVRKMECNNGPCNTIWTLEDGAVKTSPE